jgi:hypothetical protein
MLARYNCVPVLYESLLINPLLNIFSSHVVAPESVGWARGGETTGGFTTFGRGDQAESLLVCSFPVWWIVAPRFLYYHAGGQLVDKTVVRFIVSQHFELHRWCMCHRIHWFRATIVLCSRRKISHRASDRTFPRHDAAGTHKSNPLVTNVRLRIECKVAL